jgi:hypothetical protein
VVLSQLRGPLEQAASMVFPISPKKVEKLGDGKWHEVEDADAYGEEYKKYDWTVIGRALVFSKLEEAAML